MTKLSKIRKIVTSWLRIYASHTFGSILWVLLGMVALQIVSFFLLGQSKTYFLEYGLRKSFFTFISILAFGLVSVIHIRTNERMKSSRYTMGRLKIDEKSLICIQSVYIFLTYLLVWMGIVISAYAVGMLHRLVPSSAFSTSQTILYAFMQHPLLNNLMPIHKPILILIHGSFILLLSISLAVTTALDRRGKHSVATYLLIVAGAFLSITQTMKPRAVLLLLSFSVTMVVIVRLVRMEKDHE